MSGPTTPDSLSLLASLASQALASTQNPVNYIADSTHTTSFTATVGQIYSGAVEAVLELKGTLAAAANITTPNAATLFQSISNCIVGQTFKFRVVNSSTGAYTWTVVAGTGGTVVGTATVPQNTWREYLVTFTSPSTATYQSLGSGTN